MEHTNITHFSNTDKLCTKITIKNELHAFNELLVCLSNISDHLSTQNPGSNFSNRAKHKSHHTQPHTATHSHTHTCTTVRVNSLVDGNDSHIKNIGKE